MERLAMERVPPGQDSHTALSVGLLLAEDQSCPGQPHPRQPVPSIGSMPPLDQRTSALPYSVT